LALAYCAGLRLGEIVHLSISDIHLGDATIEIRDTKFFKSRRLPLSSSVMSALRCYLDARQQAGAPSEPSSGLFWQHRTAGRCSSKPVSDSAFSEPQPSDLRQEKQSDANSVSSTTARFFSRLVGAATECFPPHRAVLPGQLAIVSPVRGSPQNQVRCQAWPD